MNAKIIAAVAAVAFGSAATAALANTSGSINLRGTVQSVCTISVTDSNQSLNIVGGESNRQVGEVVENCNNGTGYNITVSSATGGNLRSGNNNVAYTLRYDTQNGPLTSAMTVQRAQAEFGRRSTVGVTIPATANAIAGAYSDTLTISISAR